MKRILLIGELNDVIRSINDSIAQQFQVQICAMQLDLIKSMIKVVKPDMLIFCQIGDDEEDTEFFGWMKGKGTLLPILIITTEEIWKRADLNIQDGMWHVLFRPVSTSVIIDNCQRMLKNPGGGESESGLSMEQNDSSERKKVMIVDDSPLTLRNIKSILEKKYDVCVAPSGEQALRLIPQKYPDVVLLDYEMGGMNGKDTFEAMLEDEYMSTIPVIFLTGIADKEKVYGVLRSRPAGYILKPANQYNLMEEISKVLQNR